jgi:hypothetical protein
MSKSDTINVSGMKDCTGREYSEGDFVSFIRPFYHDMAVGKIVRFTPKSIKVLELKTEIDVNGKLMVKPQNFNQDHTVRPSHATIINETADQWIYIPWPDQT